MCVKQTTTIKNNDGSQWKYNIGKQIAYLRQQKEWTLSDLAARASTYTSKIAAVESGRDYNINVLLSVLSALDCKLIIEQNNEYEH